jgi:hypothetical protein
MKPRTPSEQAAVTAKNDALMAKLRGGKIARVEPIIRELAASELGLNPAAYPAVNKWLARGDGIAVYENVEPDHAERGHRKFTSYGSPLAQLEVPSPPFRLPDVGADKNAAYRLVGVYRDAPLVKPEMARPVEREPEQLPLPEASS